MAKYLSYTIRNKNTGELKVVTVEEFEALKQRSQNWKIAVRHETDNTYANNEGGKIEKPVAKLAPTPKPETKKEIEVKE